MKQSNKPKREPLSRLWFMSRGYRKHPRLNLWGHEGCSYFLSAYGQKLAHDHSPSHRAKQKGRGYIPPTMRCYNGKGCHVLMGEIFYGERPVFFDQKGKPYFGICHHLIEEPLLYCQDNLLCWLTYSEHAKADQRRRALEALVPDGNLHVFSYARLRYLQDPRTLSDDDFQRELALIRDQGFHIAPDDPMEYELSNPTAYHLAEIEC